MRKPALQSRATSHIRPKVRARPTSRRKRSGLRSKRVALLADDGIGEVDLDINAEPVGVGPDLAEGVTDLGRDRLQDLNEAALCRLADDAGLVDRGNEGRGAAVHDRHFRSVDLDGGVVDAHAPQRRKHVLGGRNQRAVTIAEDGGEVGRDHLVGGRLNSRGHFPRGRCGQKQNPHRRAQAQA